MMAMPPNMAPKLSGLRVSVHMQYMKANVMPFPSRTAASGARKVSGAMTHNATQFGECN
jgi:hypothetical protein